jgi:hypothetical protein
MEYARLSSFCCENENNEAIINRTINVNFLICLAIIIDLSMSPCNTFAQRLSDAQKLYLVQLNYLKKLKIIKKSLKIIFLCRT